MSDLGKVRPIENWLNVSALDSDLQQAIEKARVEFAGRSETQITALWREFETMLNTWRAQGEGYAPVLRSNYRIPGRHRIRVGRGRGDARPDYVATFIQLANQRYVLLPRFIRSLHRNVRFGLVKALALLILREAADGNPEGALRASILFNKASVELRIVMEEGLRVRSSKPAALKPSMKGKKILVEKRDAKMPGQSRARRETGEQPGSVKSGLVSEAPSTARR